VADALINSIEAVFNHLHSDRSGLSRLQYNPMRAVRSPRKHAVSLSEVPTVDKINRQALDSYFACKLKAHLTLSGARGGPTIGFRLLYTLVIVRLARRELVWIDVTAHPTADWIAGIRDKPISAGSPWQNCFAERLIGTNRRECVDRLIVLGGGTPAGPH
jgi:hypothetical protein